MLRSLFISSTVLLLMILDARSEALSQNVIEGIILNEQTEDPLEAASVQVTGSEFGTVTDTDGKFVLADLPEGIHTLIIRHVGFQSIEKEFEFSTTDERITLEIKLSPTGVEYEDIIITASPTGSNISYQPARSFSPEELQQQSAVSFGEMLDGEPGISMRSFGPAPSRPIIRGFDGDRILILENGERMGDLSNTAHDHNISLDPLAADRIEVIRGPASLLYGSSALGGVINLITSDMPRNWSPGSGGNISLDASTMNDGVGGYGRYQYAQNTWAATGRFSYRGAGDLRTPEGRLPGTFIDNMEAAGGFGYQSDRFNTGVALSAIDHNFGLPEDPGDPDEEAEIRMNQQTLQGHANLESRGFFENTELRFHGSRLFQQEIETEYNSGGMPDEDIELEFLQFAINSTLTLHHRPIGPLAEGAWGLNLQTRQLEVGGEEIFTPGANDWSAAFFTFNELPLTDIISMQFGLRGESRSLHTRLNDAFPVANSRHTTHALSGSMGLNIRPVNQLELGAQLARAHRFPILEELYAEGVHFGAGVYESGDPGLDTEVGHGGDLFVLWKSSSMHAELSGFYYHFDNFIAFEPTGNVYTDSRNREWEIFEYRAGRSEVFGGEAQLSYVASEAFQLDGILDYVQGTNLDTRQPLPTMPPLRLRLQTRFDPGQWWLGGEIRHITSQERVAEHEFSTDGYTLLNLNAGIRFDAAGTHRISLRVDNLTDTLYRDHLSRIDRSEFGSPMPGRNINLAYRFIF